MSHNKIIILTVSLLVIAFIICTVVWVGTFRGRGDDRFGYG